MAALLREGRAVLERSAVPDAARDAEALLRHVLGHDRARLHAHPEEVVRAEDAAIYREHLDRRAARVPLQHLTGVQEFWSLPFRVSPAALIPRPETEGIVEAFLAHCHRADVTVVDLGTGSGCLAVAVARERTGALVHATDLSEAALGLARLNASDNDVAGRIAFYHGDLYEPLRGLGLEGHVDAVLSNPPYVAAADLDGLPPEVRDHEPKAALSPGSDALAAHRRVAQGAPAFLRPGGLVIVEFGLGQEAGLREIYAAIPGLAVLEVRPDLAGFPRVLVARAG